MKYVFVFGGLLVLMAITVVLVQGRLNRRKRKIIEAGRGIGLMHPLASQPLQLPFVPLIHKPGNKFLVTLAVQVGGRSTGFFDMTVSAGKDWFVQSAVVVVDPGADMRCFQLARPHLTNISQRRANEDVELPGREQSLDHLKFTTDDPAWAANTFAEAPDAYFERVREGRWTVEGLAHSVVVYRWGSKIAPAHLSEFVEDAVGLAGETLALCGARG